MHSWVLRGSGLNGKSDEINFDVRDYVVSLTKEFPVGSEHGGLKDYAEDLGNLVSRRLKQLHLTGQIDYPTSELVDLDEDGAVEIVMVILIGFHQGRPENAGIKFKHQGNVLVEPVEIVPFDLQFRSGPPKIGAAIDNNDERFTHYRPNDQSHRNEHLSNAIHEVRYQPQ